MDYDRAWSSQEWKNETTTYDRSGRPDKSSWRTVRQVRPDHEEILLDGTAQSERYGETLRDRSGRPGNINSQAVANSQNFIMGSDTTELELSVESRSLVNRVNDQVRKRQKRISNIAVNTIPPIQQNIREKWLRERVKITVSQQGKLERRVQQQAGQKAQQCEHQ